MRVGRPQHQVPRDHGLQTMRMVHLLHHLSSNVTNRPDLLDHFLNLARPGAGLRSIESSVEEMEHIFDHIFGAENENPLSSERNEPVLDLLQVYGSEEDMYATSICVATAY